MCRGGTIIINLKIWDTPVQVQSTLESKKKTRTKKQKQRSKHNKDTNQATRKQNSTNN